jgi:hypothetical protein
MEAEGLMLDDGSTLAQIAAYLPEALQLDHHASGVAGLMLAGSDDGSALSLRRIGGSSAGASAPGAAGASLGGASSLGVSLGALAAAHLEAAFGPLLSRGASLFGGADARSGGGGAAAAQRPRDASFAGARHQRGAGSWDGLLPMASAGGGGAPNPAFIVRYPARARARSRAPQPERGPARADRAAQLSARSRNRGAMVANAKFLPLLAAENPAPKRLPPTHPPAAPRRRPRSLRITAGGR